MKMFQVLLLWSALQLSISSQESPDLILHNGVVWTVDAERPSAQAIAVRNGKVQSVGYDDTILELKGPETEIIDLKGNFVLPGFNDNHVHFASAAAFLEFNVMKVSTQEEFQQRVRDAMESLPRGQWIVGGYWGAYDQWAEESAGGTKRASFTPDMRAIDEWTEDYPMFIRKFDNSEFAANSAAMKEAGLDAKNPEAEGVEFLRDHKGNWTGIFRGTKAPELFQSIIPPLSHGRRLQQTLRALKEVGKFGVTNVSDISDDEQLDIYRQLHEQKRLTVRVHFRYGLDRVQEVEKMGIKIGSGDEWIRLGALKGHIDGIMGNSTARFFEPYTNDSGNRGKWRPLMVDEQGNFEEGKFLQYMKDADQGDLQLTVHAIGDEANHLLLNYLEELNKSNGEKDRRFRLVHAQVIAPADFERLGKLGVIAEVQPFQLSDDMRWMEERIGHDRCKGAYAFRTILQNGGILSFGSDWPGTSAAEYPINPMLGLYAAVTRQTLGGEPAGGWFPEERISMKEAIKAYTYNTAYANFEEDIKGSITPGKFADLVVLDKNLLEISPREILDTRVVYTFVNGKAVYSPSDEMKE